MIVLFACSVYFVQLVIGAILLVGYFKKDRAGNNNKLSEVSIVIPFKDEARRIMGLLEDIRGLRVPDRLKCEFIFVDDRSTDGSRQIITAAKIPNASVLTSTKKGKKQAVRAGVLAANYKHVITWDADCRIETNYLVQLLKLEEVDMWILPVKLGGREMIQRLGAVEFEWLQLLGIGSANYLSPNLCNGANLLFSRKLFLKVDASREDYEIPSGDDMFLLAAFKSVDAEIHATSNANLTVSADSPNTFKKLLLQRKRWAGKMNNLKTGFAWAYGLVLLIFILLAVVMLSMIDLGWIVLIPLIMKVVNEYLILQFTKRGASWSADILTVLVHQVWYPFYLICLLLPIREREKRWS